MRWARILLGVLAVSAVPLGLWALAAPQSFFDSFPGSGRTWVAVDGPYNEHLVRDFGGLNLALAAATLAVAVWAVHRTLVAAVALAWLLFTVPHLAYHVANVDVLDTADQVAQTVSLAFVVVLSLAVAVLALWPSRAP